MTPLHIIKLLQPDPPRVAVYCDLAHEQVSVIRIAFRGVAWKREGVRLVDLVEGEDGRLLPALDAPGRVRGLPRSFGLIRVMPTDRAPWIGAPWVLGLHTYPGVLDALVKLLVRDSAGSEEAQEQGSISEQICIPEHAHDMTPAELHRLMDEAKQRLASTGKWHKDLVAWKQKIDSLLAAKGFRFDTATGELVALEGDTQAQEQGRPQKPHKPAA